LQQQVHSDLRTIKTSFYGLATPQKQQNRLKIRCKTGCDATWASRQLPAESAIWEVEPDQSRQQSPVPLKQLGYLRTADIPAFGL